MDGWELAIPTVLNTEDVQPDKTLYKEIQIDEKTHKAVSVAGTIYKFPGDYSIERLFAQLSSRLLCHIQTNSLKQSAAYPQ